VKFVQYYLDCLSQASYLIGDETTGRAAVVDPRRDVQEYLDDAAADGLSIEFVIETHVHADFLSGHLELAAATGAAIVYGAAADVHSRTARSPTASASSSAGSAWSSGPLPGTRPSRSASWCGRRRTRAPRTAC
jgi:glyoxylase-like metal-dependent hydrolase (beta-lactamase superfamily II)